jgi:hypothetical protein
MIEGMDAVINSAGEARVPVEVGSRIGRGWKEGEYDAGLTLIGALDSLRHDCRTARRCERRGRIHRTGALIGACDHALRTARVVKDLIPLTGSPVSGNGVAVYIELH